MTTKNETKSQSQVTTLDDAPKVTIPVEVTMPGNANGNPDFSGKMEVITIHSSDGEAGGDAVFLGHNGYAYQIPRDKPFPVPAEVAQILRDAKVSTYVTGEGGVVTERHRPRYAFSSEAVAA
jgi:hypothetical protein